MNERALYDKTVKCIRCGFCLEDCPTFALTGEETESPRGRIYLVRSAIEGQISWKDPRKHLDLCLGCRACETACPSGVEYGSILEMAREKMEADAPPLRRMLKRMLLAAITSKAITLIPFKKIPGMRARIPRRESRKAFPGANSAAPIGELYLLTGCVMDNLYHTTNQAARFLLERQGYGVMELRGVCCKALHRHTGIAGEEPSLPRDKPIVVTSAGCGSSLKDRGYDARDLTEVLTDVKPSRSDPVTVVYQEACHLLHGQKIKDQPRRLLDGMPGVTRVEIEEPGMCCGSAGIYNIMQPGLARQLLDRKWASIERAKPQVVVTGNPGCLAWLTQAAEEHKSEIRVVHIARFIAERCE